MSYRKITVDNVDYEYTVGKTHTKIKNIGVFKNEDIGHVEDLMNGKFKVQPNHIAKAILTYR